MAEYLIQDSTLSNMADEIRILTDTEGAMSPSVMVNNLNNFNTDVIDLITQISNALTGKAGPESDVVVSSIATTTASPSITIPDAVGKANIALMYMSSGGYQASAMADAGLGSVIVYGESHSYTIMYTSELYTDSNDGFIKYDSTTGTISLSPNRYNETFIAGNYMYVTWGSIEDNGSSALITFTIDGTSYQAEEGMTWGEWCNSSYNTTGDLRIGNIPFIGNNIVISTSDMNCYVCEVDVTIECYDADTIKKDGEYIIMIF